MGDGSSGRRWSLIYAREARAKVEDELAFHLEQRTRDNMARGMDAGAARATAQQRLGDLASVQRESTQLLRAERRAEARSHFMKMSALGVCTLACIIRTRRALSVHPTDALRADA
jgi:hypothetical protein